MAKLVVLYKTPKDAAAFDNYYSSTHIPTLTFGSMADLQRGLASPEGQAAAGDLANFADGGADLLMFEARDA